MGWTNSIPIFHDNVTFILQAEILHVTTPVMKVTSPFSFSLFHKPVRTLTLTDTEQNQKSLLLHISF
jgi:hypothetical protein